MIPSSSGFWGNSNLWTYQISGGGEEEGTKNPVGNQGSTYGNSGFVLSED